MLYDLIIIGGGPAGVAAGVYASRKRMKSALIASSVGGQSAVSENIQNWIGTVSISGTDLAKNLEAHLRAYADDTLEIKSGEKCKEVSKTSDGFLVKTDSGEYLAKTVLIATGSHRKKLNVPGADKFENKGVTYCASCDGPLFTDMDVVVVGGGNAGFETAAELLAYTKSVVLLHYRDEFKADPVTVKKILSNPKMHAILNAEITEVIGDKFVTGVSYKNKETGDKINLPAQGIFVEIGALPTTDFAKDLVNRNEKGQIIIDPKSQRTSVEGVWAAGDCTDGLYHQNNIAAGDAVKAIEDIYMWLNAK
ncbi:MAG: FAD-dependent oxidoreductase [Candidatus Paceibacterota bacterium]